VCGCSDHVVGVLTVFAFGDSDRLCGGSNLFQFLGFWQLEFWAFGCLGGLAVLWGFWLLVWWFWPFLLLVFFTVGGS